MKDTVLIEEMSWAELDEAIKEGKTTALLCAGAMEQHGPHLPIATDTLMGYAVGQRVAKKLGNALVAPVIRPGLSEHHTDFPGTFTVSFETFCKLVEECCASLARHGFEYIVVISSHGGNNDALKAITPYVSKKISDRATAFFLIADERAHQESTKRFMAKTGATLGEMGAHSGLSETSMVLAVRPELVDMSRARRGLSDDEFYLPENVLISQMDAFTHGIKSQSDNGILGDPLRASAKLGEEMLEAYAEEEAAQIRKIIAVLEKNKQAKRKR
jgi:creatinine amidohydrolase